MADLRSTSCAKRKKPADQQHDQPNDDPSGKMTKVESHADPVPLRNQESAVLAVEVEDAKSPVIVVLVGQDHAGDRSSLTKPRKEILHVAKKQHGLVDTNYPSF